MKITYKSLLAFSVAAFLTTHACFAGENNIQTASPQAPPIEKSASPWHATLTEGWDSLYMNRGVNILGGNSKYGSSLLWTDLTVTLNLTSNDFLTADVWNAFGLGHGRYAETDACLMYTHTFGNLFVCTGYMFCAMTSMQMYMNELHAKVGYNIDAGPVTITPSIAYFFDLGPDTMTMRSHGLTSSYLELRVDASIPLYKEIVSLTPWISYGQNFRYNAQEKSDSITAPFDGANNLEVGIALPIKVNRFITVSGYGSYSYNFENLVSTSPSTFWGGAKVSFAF